MRRNSAWLLGRFVTVANVDPTSDTMFYEAISLRHSTSYISSLLAEHIEQIYYTVVSSNSTMNLRNDCTHTGCYSEDPDWITDQVQNSKTKHGSYRLYWPHSCDARLWCWWLLLCALRHHTKIHKECSLLRMALRGIQRGVRLQKAMECTTIVREVHSERFWRGLIESTLTQYGKGPRRGRCNTGCGTW